MKILMINSVCGIRSTGRICTDLAQSLEARGHQVRIAYGRETVPEPFQKYAVRIGGPWGVRLHGLKARVLDASGFGSGLATRRFLAWVRGYDPDVIHLHNLHGYYLHVGLLFDYLRTCGKPIIWTLHDCWAFTGHSPLCGLKDCRRWTSGCGDCPLKTTYPAAFWDRSRQNLRKKRAAFTHIPNLQIVTPSSWLAGLVRSSFLGDVPVTVIGNGIDTRIFHPTPSDFRRESGLEGKLLLLGAATAWNRTKGLEDFISLAKRLPEPFRILMLGLDPGERRDLPGNMIPVEPVSDPRRLAEIYSAADLLLNLSYCETYPTVNLEAIACGTHVITYDAGGSPETLCFGTGDVVPRGDLDALYSRVVSCLRETPGRKTPPDREKLDRRWMLDRYLALYCGEAL